MMEESGSTKFPTRQVPVDLETVNLLRADIAKSWDMKKRAAPRSHPGHAWALGFAAAGGLCLGIALVVVVVAARFRLALSSVGLLLLVCVMAFGLAAFLAQMVASTASILAVRKKGDTNIRWMREYSEFDVSFVNTLSDYGIAEIAFVLRQFQQNLWDTHWRAAGVVMIALIASVSSLFVNPGFFFSSPGWYYGVVLIVLPQLLVYAFIFERMSRLREVANLLELAVTLRI